MPNGKREFVPRDQVSPFTCRLLLIILTDKLVVSRSFLSIRIVLSCFYLLIFYFETFSTWIWRFPFAVYVMFKLSIHKPMFITKNWARWTKRQAIRPEYETAS